MLVRKHIASPGMFWYVDRATGRPACLNATAERIRKWHDNGNAMLSAGLSIPVPLEHKEPDEPGAAPMTRTQIAAQQIRDNTGWTQKFEMDGDSLFSVLDIQDTSILGKLGKTVKWTSPWIASFVDGDGRAWDEAPLHVALTSRPRITKQKPFPTVSAAMSVAPAPALPKDGICISRAGMLHQVGQALKPVYPMAFSLWSGAMLAEDEMPKAEKKPPAEKPAAKEGEKPPVEGKPAEGKPGEGKPEQTPVGEMPKQPEIGPDGQPVPEALVDPDGDISVEDVIADLLCLVGVEIGEGTPENFRERLYRGVMEAHKAKLAPPEAPMGTPPNQPNQPPANPVIAETQPMYMSIDEIKKAIAKMPDGEQKAMYSAMLSMTETNMAQAEALKKHAFDQAKKERDARVTALCKRAGDDKDFAESLTALATGAQFSMDANGQVVDTLAPTLTAFEKGFAKMPHMPAILAALTRQGGAGFSLQDIQELPHPQETDPTGMSAERAKELADEQLSKHGPKEKSNAA